MSDKAWKKVHYISPQDRARGMEDALVRRRVSEHTARATTDASIVAHALIEEIIREGVLHPSAIPGDNDKVLHVEITDLFLDNIMWRMAVPPNGKTETGLTRNDLTPDFLSTLMESVGIHFIIRKGHHSHPDYGNAPASEVLDAVKRLRVNVPEGSQFLSWARVQSTSNGRVSQEM